MKYKSILLVTLFITLFLVVFCAYKINQGQDVTIAWVLLAINATGALLSIWGILR